MGFKRKWNLLRSPKLKVELCLNSEGKLPVEYLIPNTLPSFLSCSLPAGLQSTEVRKLPLSDSVCDANILTSDFPFTCSEGMLNTSEGQAWQRAVCAGTFPTTISQFSFSIHYLVMMCNTVIEGAEYFKGTKFMESKEIVGSACTELRADQTTDI